ncbi:zf-HC2 domain-containing protein [Lysobacter sp. CFH 32150]|uniref:zf-HC2 domain-containing protein n=1 Tax=Lysobacter sp. CFH 32150 TaxID=2927128 RepID=UPI001FA714CC|nr:zf-HC2 domain-containing protein [Lysobacter sp. CFH 32150]MCI4568318.1 zf-HC2 domain-containing protein [Lysobacter sp. CFH 32150]
MSGHVLRFEGSAHSETERLLPWFVNGTLEQDERVLVEGHLAECAHCRGEIAVLQQLQDLHADAAPAVDASASFQRLRGRLSVHGTTPRASRWQSLRRGWMLTPQWLRGTVAVQALVVLVLTVVLIGPDRPGARYRTLGDAAPAAASQEDVRQLVVVFDPHISQAQMRQLLRASQARIIDGPSDAGAYVLAVPATRASSVRDALRAAPGVTMVERLDPVE